MEAARILAIMFSKSTKLDLKKELTDVNYFPCLLFNYDNKLLFSKGFANPN